MKEHKKLYKAGKNWVTTTILTAAITATGLYASSPVYAANDEQNTNSTVAQIQNDQPLTVSDAQTNNQSIDNASKQAELEQQIKQAQTEVQQKQNDYNNAQDEKTNANLKFKNAQRIWERNRNNYGEAEQTTIDIYEKTDHELSLNSNQLLNEWRELSTSNVKEMYEQYMQKYRNTFDQITTELNKPLADKDFTLIDSLLKQRDEYYAKAKELEKQGKNANDDVYKKFTEAEEKSENFTKSYSQHINKFDFTVAPGFWYTFDRSLLSSSDQIKYDQAISYINQNRDKLSEIYQNYSKASEENIHAENKAKDAKDDLSKAQAILSDLQNKLTELQHSSSASSSAAKPSDSSASSSAAKPSDSSASSSAAKPSDSSASSSAAKPSDSSASSSAAKPSDSSASSSAAKPSDSSASSSAAKPSDSSASSSAAKPSDSSATQLNASSGVAQSINDDKVSFGAADIKSRLGAKPTQVAFVVPNSSQSGNPDSNQSQKRNSLPQTGNTNKVINCVRRPYSYLWLRSS